MNFIKNNIQTYPMYPGYLINVILDIVLREFVVLTAKKCEALVTI